MRWFILLLMLAGCVPTETPRQRAQVWYKKMSQMKNLAGLARLQQEFCREVAGDLRLAEEFAVILAEQSK